MDVEERLAPTLNDTLTLADEHEEENEDKQNAKTRKPRSKFTEAQIAILKEAFEVSHNMNRKRCEELIAETGLTKRQVIVWFMNRRAHLALEKRLNANNDLPSLPQLSLEKEQGTMLPLKPRSNVLKSQSVAQIAQKFSKLSSSPSKNSSQTAAKKAKRKYHQMPRGPKRKDRTPPRMLPQPKIVDSPSRGPPDITLPIVELNFMLTCKICRGYLYNAATITECLHSFCKSCLARYIVVNLHCPQCGILIHPSNPFVNIRLDSTVQDIVYKILPDVEKEDKSRAKAFYESRGLEYPPKPPREPTPPPVDPIEESEEESEYSDYSDESDEEIIAPDWISVMLNFAGVSQGLNFIEPVVNNYLRLPATSTIGNIRKLITTKLELSKHQSQVELLVDMTLVHDSLTLDEIKRLFFTDEEEELLVLDYAIVPNDMNFFSDPPPQGDIVHDFCDDMVSEDYFVNEDSLNTTELQGQDTPTP